jgi:hypothetical protein
MTEEEWILVTDKTNILIAQEALRTLLSVDEEEKRQVHLILEKWSDQLYEKINENLSSNEEIS